MSLGMTSPSNLVSSTAVISLYRLAGPYQRKPIPLLYEEGHLIGAYKPVLESSWHRIGYQPHVRLCLLL